MTSRAIRTETLKTIIKASLKNITKDRKEILKFRYNIPR